MAIYERSKYYTALTEEDKNRGLSPLLIRALRARGAVTDEEIKSFLYPSPADFYNPFLLPDMDKAVERIERALSCGERICVFGDYDVDGICATAMIVDYLRSINANVCYHIPSRREEGYGMSRIAIEKLLSMQVNLIITVDNGISAAEEIEYCVECGMDVIVTDHHIPPENIPKCSAVVCHTIAGSSYPTTTLCGAGIAFKLLHALAGLETALNFVSLAGLASVADVVPLTDENRILVKLGLDALNSNNCCLGLMRLLDSIPTAKKPYTTCNLGFAAAPRLNASGRMSDASLAVELFLTDDMRRIDEIISQLNRLNELRQQEEAGILSSALEMICNQDLSMTRAIILKSDKWNAGVIGIAASRISEMYHRPTILFSEANGMLKGSARSIEGVNIHEAFCAVCDCFTRFGGHARAAGVTMESVKFDEFVSAFNRYLDENCDIELFIPRKSYEFDISVGEVTHELVKDISLLAPFGEGNPSPIFHANGVRLAKFKKFGVDAQHMRMEAWEDSKCIEVVWFASASSFDRLINADTTEMLFTISVNNWNGTENLQLRLISAKAELPHDADSYVQSRIPRFCSAFVENCIYPQKAEACHPLERTKIDLCRINNTRLSGVLILVFTPAGARQIIKDMSRCGIQNIELCCGRVSASNVYANTILIAPKLGELPSRGFNYVAFYDVPPSTEAYDIVCDRMQGSTVVANDDALCDFEPIASQFVCNRDFLCECYKKTQCMLSYRRYSWDELTARLSEQLSIPEFMSEFAIGVFIQLNFIRQNDTGSLSMVEDIKSTSLRCSPMYRLVLEHQQQGEV